MRKILISIIIVLAFSINANSQECKYCESFDWLVETIENNDAGFQLVIDKKGIEDYKSFKEKLRIKIEIAEDSEESYRIMTEYLHYFRKVHLYLRNNDRKPYISSYSDSEIREMYKDTKTVNLTEKQFVKKYDKKKITDPIEGIWKTQNYTFGIKPKGKSDSNFVAFIIKADSVYWMPMQIKGDIKLMPDKSYSLQYYMKNHDTIPVKVNFINDTCSIVYLKDDNNMMNGSLWHREYPKPKFTEEEKVYESILSSSFPFLRKLSDKTVYMRIPSFRFNQKVLIDSILDANKELITNTDNLIIDIRYGTGGSDYSWEGLMPYINANPYRYSGIEFLGSELNAKAYEGYTVGKTDSIYIKKFNDIAKSMRNHKGEFFNYYGKEFGTKGIDTVYEYPKKVAIIVNSRNGSADEQFLITAKQSSKVKIYGTPTMGCLDVSNLSLVKSPDEKFSLYYAMSKSCRIPEYPIDGIGIQPDIYLDETIKDYDWLKHVRFFIER